MRRRDIGNFDKKSRSCGKHLGRAGVRVNDIDGLGLQNIDEFWQREPKPWRKLTFTTRDIFQDRDSLGPQILGTNPASAPDKDLMPSPDLFLGQGPDISGNAPGIQMIRKMQDPQNFLLAVGTAGAPGLADL